MAGERLGLDEDDIFLGNTSIKRRLAYSEGLSLGTIVLNECSGTMLTTKERSMSILPIGVTHVMGTFKKGDVIEIRNVHNKKIGFGVAAYDSEKVEQALGKKGGRAVVHYDYLFIE